VKGQVRWVEKTTPYSQPGLGMALWAAMIWSLVMVFKATIVVAKWTVVAVAAVVALVVGWIADRR
jgi:hypothetical protein